MKHVPSALEETLQIKSNQKTKRKRKQDNLRSQLSIPLRNLTGYNSEFSMHRAEASRRENLGLK